MPLLEEPHAKNLLIYLIYYEFPGDSARPRRAQITENANNIFNLLCDPWPKVLDPVLAKNYIIYSIIMRSGANPVHPVGAFRAIIYSIYYRNYVIPQK